MASRTRFTPARLLAGTVLPSIPNGKKQINESVLSNLDNQNLPIAIMTAAALLFVASPELQR